LKDDAVSRTLRRYQPFLDSLPPSAIAWMEHRAKIEAKRPTLDLQALRRAVWERFSDSLPQPGPEPKGIGLQVGGDVAEMAVIIIMMMVQDGDKDLNSEMAEAEAQMQAKQSLRALLNEMDQLQMQLIDRISRGEPDCGCITSRQLLNVISQLDDKLCSDDEASEMTSMQLQTLMDARSKLLQTASDMEKSMSDTEMAIVGNIKR
jgi:hypothetical protein